MNSPIAQPGVGERRGYIGGSDVAAILSLSPYADATPFQVFAQKVGVEITRSIDPDRDEQMEAGKEMEVVIASLLTKRTGIATRRPPQQFYTHKTHAFIGGHPDFLCKDGLVECKNIAYQHDEWQEPRELDQDSSDLVPLYYLTQVDHYMLLLDLPVTFLVALFTGHKLKVYRIDRNASRESILLAAEIKFWERVVNDDPPPFSGIDDRIAALRAGYIESHNAERAKKEKKNIQLDEIGQTLLAIVHKERSAINRAKKRADTARKALIEHLGAQTGYLYVGKDKQGSFLVSKRENFDEFSLKLAHPDLHAQYVREALTEPVLRLTKDYESEHAQDQDE